MRTEIGRGESKYKGRAQRFATVEPQLPNGAYGATKAIKAPPGGCRLGASQCVELGETADREAWNFAEPPLPQVSLSIENY